MMRTKLFLFGLLLLGIIGCQENTTKVDKQETGSETMELNPQEQMIHRRAVEAAVWAMPIEGTRGLLLAARKDLGADWNDIIYFSKPGARPWVCRICWRPCHIPPMMIRLLIGPLPAARRPAPTRPAASGRASPRWPVRADRRRYWPGPAGAARPSARRGPLPAPAARGRGVRPA